MIAFKVEGMFSGRSAGAIVKSVKALDHRATVRVDLVNHLVEVEPTWTEAGELGEAIERAGFAPAVVISNPPAPAIWDGVVDVLLPAD